MVSCERYGNDQRACLRLLISCPCHCITSEGIAEHLLYNSTVFRLISSQAFGKSGGDGDLT